MTHCNFPKSRLAYLVGAALSTLLTVPAAQAFFQPGGITDPNFEIDVPANALDQPTSGVNYLGDDWQTVYKCFQDGDGYNLGDCTALGGLNANLINTTGILHDHAPHTIFTTGGSKDPQKIEQWRWKEGSVPDKDNILHAGAAAYMVNNELIMYIFADRYSNDGDAMMGAWFFQDEVKTIESGPDAGKFSGSHKNGDILWLGHFSGGGVVASLQVLKWNAPGSGGADTACTDANPALPNQIKGTNLCLVSEGPGGPGTGYVASVTDVAQDKPSRLAPWDYTPKQGPAGYFPYNSFMEGGINITQMLGATPCFSSFLLETRSSTSVTATLKDFVLGQIDTCKIEVDKTCTAQLDAERDGIDYNFRIYVKNSGFANLTSVTFQDNRRPGENPWTWTPAGGLTPAMGWVKAEDYTVNTTQQELSNEVTATGHVGGYDTAPATDTVTCPNVPVPATLTVTKDCDKTELVVDNRGTPGTAADDRLWVNVHYKGTVCNTGPVKLDTVQAWEKRVGVPDTSVTSWTWPMPAQPGVLNAPGIGPAGSDCAQYSGAYFPNQRVDSGVTVNYNTGTQCFTEGVSQHWVDNVDASARNVISGATVKATENPADCYLCPHCPTP